MTEAEVVEQLVEFTSILLLGVSVFFTVVSAYIAGLNYFIGGASFLARLLAFLFITAVLLMLIGVIVGGQVSHGGLIARLHELDGQGALTAAGRALLANSTGDAMLGPQVSLDNAIRAAVWSLLGLTYLVLFYLTFLHRWRPETIPVVLQQAR